jgi:UDP-N-acetylmuramate-alanine ligase
MKKFLVFERKKGAINGAIGMYNSKQEAANKVIEICETDSNISIFDFDISIVENKDVNEMLTDYETANEYLNLFKDNFNKNNAELDGKLITEANPMHIKALIALNRLFTIAQAWNKADEFTPDFGDYSQDKWFPWFTYNKELAGFVYANADNAPSYTYADFGSRLCFKSSARARQFGEQFIDLWNEALLLEK